MKKKAKFIKDVSEKFMGHVYLYELDPVLCGHKYVVSSAVSTMFGSETFIFGCDKDGNVDNWVELDGSFVGGLDCEKAIINAGYEIE